MGWDLIFFQDMLISLTCWKPLILTRMAGKGRSDFGNWEKERIFNSKQ